MTDLIDRLAALGPATSEPSDATVADDVRRGRRALLHRRAVRGITGGALALAIAAAATAVVVDGQDQPAPSAGHGTATSRPTHSTPGTVALVDYTGPQLTGFIVTKVPEGFVLQGANAYSLDVARPGDTSSIDDFTHKIVVMLQSKDVTFSHRGTRVSVNGHEGYLRDLDLATELEYTDGTHDIVVQAWDGIGLTPAQLVEFAEGITVTDAAQAGMG